MWESDLQCQSTVSKNVQPCRNVTWVGWRNAAERVTWMTGNLSSSGMLLKTRQLTITPCKSHSHTVSLQWDIPACGKMWKHSTFKKKKERKKKRIVWWPAALSVGRWRGKEATILAIALARKPPGRWALHPRRPWKCAHRSEVNEKLKQTHLMQKMIYPIFFKIPCF